MHKIVIACDSFKGSLSSKEVSETIGQAIRQINPDITIQSFKVADGGEGSRDAIKAYIKNQEQAMLTFDPLMRKIKSSWLSFERNGKPAAFIELADASGITLLRQEELNPMLTTTYGTGLVIKDALCKGFTDITLALGGSATNDGGIGILNALGIRFLNNKGQELEPCGKSLIDIRYIDTTRLIPQARKAHFTLACDVTNPLCGKSGAAHVFARQKGADESMIKELDRGLRNFAGTINRQFGNDITDTVGSGAAGGVAGGMTGLLNAEIKSGADMILDIIGFDKAITNARFVITGEGSFDNQTSHGKLPYAVANHAKRNNIPVILICGKNKTGLHTSDLYCRIIETCPKDMPIVTAMQNSQAKANITRAIKEQLHDILIKNR